MALFNYATKEITLKIVYYGPGLSGKTTNLQYLHSILNPSTTGKLLSLSTEADRTLFFDFLPVELGKIRDFSIRFQLYTVPGQVRYNATRRIVLKGGDAVIFVADSQRDMREQNIESFDNMMENLHSNSIKPDEIPIILQYNKRDLSNILSVDELNYDLNKDGRYSVTEAVATRGTGVEGTYKLVTRLLLMNIARKHKVDIKPAAVKDDKREPIKPFPPPISEEAPAPPSGTNPELVVTFSESPPFPAETSLAAVPSVGSGADEDSEVYAIDLEDEEREALTVPESPPRLSTGPAAKPDIFTDVTVKMPFINKEASADDDEEKDFVKEAREHQVFTADRFNDLNKRMEKMTAALTEISEYLAKMSKSLSAHEDTLRQLEGLREVRREQGEMNTLLKSLVSFLNGLKEKKSWFRF